jgi:hypothetical protein
MKSSLLFHPTSLSHHAGQKLMVAFIAATCLGFAFSRACAAPKSEEKLTDRQINSAVDYKLFTDGALLNDHVYASTAEGIVTLAGIASHLIAKERAAMRRVSGQRCSTRSLRAPGGLSLRGAPDPPAPAPRDR